MLSRACRFVELHQRLALARENSGIAADRDEGEASREHLAAVVLASRQKARRLAGFLDPGAGVDDRAPDLRAQPVIGVAEVGGKVGGPDEDAVDAINRGDLLDRGDRLARL